MAVQTLPLLDQNHPYLSQEIIGRYNLLANFLNDLPEVQIKKLEQSQYLTMVKAFYDYANKKNNRTQTVTLQDLLVVEQGYDHWAGLETSSSGSTVSARPQYVSSHQAAFFSRQPQQAPTQPAVYSDNSNENSLNTYHALAIGSLILGVIGVAVALEPVAWIIGLAILAVSPPAFTAVVTIYAAAVATCFIAAAIFAIKASEPEPCLETRPAF